MSEAADNNENLGFWELVKRAYHRKQHIETTFNNQQTALKNGEPNPGTKK